MGNSNVAIVPMSWLLNYLVFKFKLRWKEQLGDNRTVHELFSLMAPQAMCFTEQDLKDPQGEKLRVRWSATAITHFSCFQAKQGPT